MKIKSFEKTIAVIIFLGLTLGSINYATDMTNTVSQLKVDSLEFQDQLLETRQQLSDVSDSYSQLQEQTTRQGPRYTGNPFSTQLWPGQLQSENITGMHWYSLYNGALVNVTDNVLGLGGEGDYTTWTHVWSRDYASAINFDGFHITNIGTVYASDSSAEYARIRTYAGAETNYDDYTVGMWFYPIWGAASVGNRYVVAQNTSGVNTYLHIWKDDVMIWSRYIGDDTPEAFYPELVGMSPNGKYLAVAGIDSVTYDTSIVMLYEGS